jgi:hypothetical protein
VPSVVSKTYDRTLSFIISDDPSHASLRKQGQYVGPTNFFWRPCPLDLLYTVKVHPSGIDTLDISI